MYGVTGSGKTTLAGRLSEKTGIPWQAVDDLTWEPGWIQVPDEVQRERIATICERDAWILDAAYSRWADIPMSRVELVVALDFPRLVSLTRLVRRTLTRAIDGKPICNGNRETLKMMLSRDSILLWHFKSFRRKREHIERWCRAPGSFEVLRFRSPRDVERWLEGIEREDS